MLNNLKVLAFTHYLQGPSCAQIFGDLGADVIKIESPKGAFERSWSGPGSFVNGVSVFFMLANRNMRSMAINLKSEEGKRIIYQLNSGLRHCHRKFPAGCYGKIGICTKP